MKIIKKTTLLLLTLFSILNLLVNKAIASDDLELNWYFVKRENEKTPEPP